MYCAVWHKQARDKQASESGIILGLPRERFLTRQPRSGFLFYLKDTGALVVVEICVVKIQSAVVKSDGLIFIRIALCDDGNVACIPVKVQYV